MPTVTAVIQAPDGASVSSEAQRRLRERLEQGLPLSPRPWRVLAEQCGLTEGEVLACVHRWQANGLIKRQGLVVRHRPLGIRANAMVVWDVPDARVAEAGRRLAREVAVTLCYRRPRCLPDWPYNLFCMLHGIRRERVLAELAAIVERQGLADLEHRVLFSERAYRQCGGRYAGEPSP
ncbi:siroheme decarboxylase subunit beta [Halomonas maura]|uniref:siroheme decarboxylase subunit beta n=1 Tax=Halomonas maura TaxID=117606 RepID=UPI0025B52B37|nr:AsnC family protein [Halomonas maura]MDN3555846.1 AsnC family protein [Halomonas maura]